MALQEEREKEQRGRHIVNRDSLDSIFSSSGCSLPSLPQTFFDNKRRHRRPHLLPDSGRKVGNESVSQPGCQPR